MGKKLYLTKQETSKLWHYVGDPLNPNTTLDVGLVEVENRAEIRVNEYGTYVIRFLASPLE